MNQRLPKRPTAKNNVACRLWPSHVLRPFSNTLKPKDSLKACEPILRELLPPQQLTDRSGKRALAKGLERVLKLSHAQGALVLYQSPEGDLRLPVLVGPGLDIQEPTLRGVYQHPPNWQQTGFDPFFDTFKRGRSTIWVTETMSMRPENHPFLGVPIQTLLALPIFDGPDILGVLAIINRGNDQGQAEDFQGQDLKLASDFAAVARFALRPLIHQELKINDQELTQVRAQLSNNWLCDLDQDFPLDLEWIRSFDQELLRKAGIVPLMKATERSLIVALRNPFHETVLREFKETTRLTFREVLVATSEQIDAALDEAFVKIPEGPKTSSISLGELGFSAEEQDFGEFEGIQEHSAPIIRLVETMFRNAIKQRASDIHLEAHERRLGLRFRVDGVCREIQDFPRGLHGSLVNRIKIMSDLDIAQHRMPQDGRIELQRYFPDLPYDLRVSIAPMIYGESVVLRILDKQRTTLPLEQLGYSDEIMTRYLEGIEKPYGMILHTGPTGSGKSMSLYSALNSLQTPAEKIVTAEDPVEYTLPGIQQLQVLPQSGLTFAKALRCFLRHDPDIILVGEIRDAETAKTAVEASLTGHKLLSTLHTNDAASSVTRLAEIGINPFLIASSLLVVCAQRLLRKLCECKDLVGPGDYMPTGCELCANEGYKGRTGVFEVMIVDDPIQEFIIKNRTGAGLKDLAIAQGMRSLYEEAYDKANVGITSHEEVARHIVPD